MKQFNGAFFRDLWQMTKPYWWHSEERWMARGVFACIILLNLFMVFISYRITEWYAVFWNALQRFAVNAAWHQMLIFLGLATLYIVAAVSQTFFTQMLEIRWRRWLTKHYLDAWLAKSTFYHMQVLGDGTDNPDQRISEDLASFTGQTLNIVIGLLSSVTTLAAFVFMLWNLSAMITIPWQGSLYTIPGYLVWAALIYSIFGTILAALIGRPLISLNFNQERFQADFRFSMMRLRENSESIALYGGEAEEHHHFLQRFANVYANYWRIIWRSMRLNWWVSGYGQAAIIFPILVSLPAYFVNRAIGIGGLQQIAAAFGQVQGALSFIVSSYGSLANWHAVVDRLRFFERSMDEVRIIRETHYQIERKDGPRLLVKDLNVRLPDGRELIHRLDMDVQRGQRLLIMGPSGSGKSTLVRALAGIWPFGEGVVQMPQGDRPLFLPQKPYLPLGTLRDVLVYPFGVPGVSDVQLQQVLHLVAMDALVDKLEDARLWSHVLSLGEQQRLAFARILLQKPQWVFLDEASSALDEPAEDALYHMLVEVLPETAIISVGHRSSLLRHHQYCLRLQGDGCWHLETVVHPVSGGQEPVPI
ncbi:MULTISPECIES: ABC transporter ATP-binding protein/permease [Acidithiobacillus]|uniref:ABC transporter ATP-binding protein n=3 Tax=Acidithiobacillus TaxID=119977 RepID=A0A179BH38_ACIFR|nr:MULTISPECIES: ABC transporter ATP-binding protein/permease [Acidithiobacillus]MDA8152128.1 ABC transporter ATP-binding protein/permease [Acidithiobacillus sp.]MBU2826997.1 ABC transporter ATP-binding protein/permease [Acidithiobacillus ferriphilus]MBU2832387.1 ABC transporter ATP-binding protein/permease [Acidithiobacillus ferriphilus]MBU2852479.1 ABC transporter ATP-binding protein/permease [Acidithiobacillus ferriphilus]MEB8475464.1 ABC transporter ATP-binding protein/permease [Acidithiob